MTAPEPNGVPEPEAGVVYGDPIPRPVAEEVVQMLGYEPRDVVYLMMSWRHVEVAVVSVEDHEVRTRIRWHTIV